MTKLLDFPEALEAAGVNVRVLDGWDRPAKSGYYWRESSDEPAGHMHHHTASSAYTPNRDKANGWAGLSLDGSDRLYQEDYGDGLYVPTFVIANAYPAPVSSGAGDESVLARVRDGIEVVGRQGPDTPNFYGNTHYWNTEWVLNGIGAVVDQRVWDMMVVVCKVQNALMGWHRAMHIGHGHHTRRKIDLYSGQYEDFNETVLTLRNDMESGPMWCDDWTDLSWMTFFDDTEIPNVEGDGRYYCSNDGTYDFEAKTGVKWGDGAHDGEAAYAEKVHAINYVFSGLAVAVGGTPT